MVELFANSADPDQMPHSAASNLGLHCLPVNLLGVSRLQWVNGNICCGYSLEAPLMSTTTCFHE